MMRIGKRIPKYKFLLWITIMTTAWTGIAQFFFSFIDRGALSELKAARLEKDLNSQRRLAQRAFLQLNEYKDAVALSGVKIKEDTPWQSAERMIASSFSDLSTKKSILPKSGTKTLETALALFRSEKYARSSDLFETFVTEFPEHPRAPEATLYLIESEYYLGKQENCLRFIDQLISHYPETPFAGVALLRLAKILEARERIEDAADVYHSVIAHYKGSKAEEMARKSLQDLNL